ncbi:MAG: glycoside hydrolase family 2 protein, partial [Pirellulales bacterium]
MRVIVKGKLSRNYCWIVMALVAGSVCAASAESKPRFVTPGNERELEQRIEQLQAAYAPYLRSLPKKMDVRRRTSLNGDWKFVFEVKDPPRDIVGVPPAPKWYTADFDDSKWENTTVPEWRYRTRGHDNAYDLKTVDQWVDYEGARTTSQICWYRRTFTTDRPAAGERLWLCFDGVDWEAQVYLNGQRLGSHRVYYEPFRFDVTDKVKAGDNRLAVRVIDGREYGEPMTYWATFPDIRAERQRYTPDRSESIRGNRPIGYHCGTGFGIWRDVTLQRTGPVRVDALFARNDLSDGNARIRIELDSPVARNVQLKVQLLPENHAGRPHEKTIACDLPKGSSVRELAVPMPGARVWSPDSPNLYRCRVTVSSGAQVTDATDILFGCRSFTLVHNKPQPPVHTVSLAAKQADAALPDRLPEGMLLLNGVPCYLRGTNIQGLNAYAYWGQTERLVHAVLMLKAGNFNAVRVCQHVQMPEVRELLDRLGMLSEQDQGGGYNGSLPDGIRRQQHIHTGRVLARVTYNNPAVVLLAFGNEHEFGAAPVVRAVLAVDPQRIVKPISGRFTHSAKPWDLPEELRANAIDDGHPYSGWYGKVLPQTWRYGSPLEHNTGGGGRMVTLGEFGAEAMDAYETMKTYPPQFAPPPPDTDTLWACSQVQKHDVKQLIGLGRNPTNLTEYIE